MHLPGIASLAGEVGVVERCDWAIGLGQFRRLPERLLSRSSEPLVGRQVDALAQDADSRVLHRGMTITLYYAGSARSSIAGLHLSQDTTRKWDEHVHCQT